MALIPSAFSCSRHVRSLVRGSPVDANHYEYLSSHESNLMSKTAVCDPPHGCAHHGATVIKTALEQNTMKTYSTGRRLVATTVWLLVWASLI